MTFAQPIARAAGESIDIVVELSMLSELADSPDQRHVRQAPWRSQQTSRVDLAWILLLSAARRVVTPHAASVLRGAGKRSALRRAGAT